MTTFNWHEESKKNSFVAWAFTTSMSKSIQDPDKFKHLSETTDKFHNVEMIIKVGGVEVDGNELLTRMWQEVKRQIGKEAAALVREKTNMHQVDDIMAEVRLNLLDQLANIGIVIDPEDD